MNIVIIVPTGVGAEIGGHNGDANPVVKLFGVLSDTVITHPNVVNGSDINEMPYNTMYVDGYMLDQFLLGHINLIKSKNKRILLATNSPVKLETINAVSASRVTLGIDIDIIELKTDLVMTATKTLNGVASGVVKGWKELVDQVNSYTYDALAIASPIQVDDTIAKNYLLNGGVNPWGGVEAMASRLISAKINKPVAHSPVESGTLKGFKNVVDPRMAAEMLSETFLHSVLKGLHNAPQSVEYGGLNYINIDFLISPAGLWGEPHKAMLGKAEIIIVKENTTVLNNTIPNRPDVHVCDNYLEAAGIVACKQAGILSKYVRRPIAFTKIIL